MQLRRTNNVVPVDATSGSVSHDVPGPDEVTGTPASAIATEVGEASGNHSQVGIAVGLLTLIAIVAALYLARAFFVPLLIGILASYSLSPLVEWLKCLRVPRPVGAALILAVLAGGLSWGLFSLSDDAAAVIKKLPEAARMLRKNLSVARMNGPTALQNMREATNELQGAAADAGTKGATRIAARPIRAACKRNCAGAHRFVTDVFPAGVRQPFPPQAGGIRGTVVISKEGYRAHTRRNRHAGTALPPCHTDVERTGRRGHLACLRSAGHAGRGCLGHRSWRAALYSLSGAGTDCIRKWHGWIPAVRIGVACAGHRGNVFICGGHDRSRLHDLAAKSLCACERRSAFYCLAFLWLVVGRLRIAARRAAARYRKSNL